MTEPVHPLIDHPLPGACRLMLNRPEQRKALNSPLRGEIFARLANNQRDPAVRATASRGTGAAFCSGDDRSAANTVGQRQHSASGLGQWSRDVVDGCLRIWNLAKPVVAQVRGDCLGGGSELAASHKRSVQRAPGDGESVSGRLSERGEWSPPRRATHRGATAGRSRDSDSSAAFAVAFLTPAARPLGNPLDSEQRRWLRSGSPSLFTDLSTESVDKCAAPGRSPA